MKRHLVILEGNKFPRIVEVSREVIFLIDAINRRVAEGEALAGEEFITDEIGCGIDDSFIGVHIDPKADSDGARFEASIRLFGSPDPVWTCDVDSIEEGKEAIRANIRDAIENGLIASLGFEPCDVYEEDPK